VKHQHEIRDAIHVFIRLDSDERLIVDSAPVQRLRHIQQLALTNLVYPGATHKRFEHSLGVMELAGRVYDVLTTKELPEKIRKVLPVDLHDEGQRRYWRRVLRLAALTHDIGHLPFSHAAEKDLLPNGWDHERITRELLASAPMRDLFHKMRPPIIAEDVIKVAVGPRKVKDLTFTPWDTILSDIIVSDAFGVDRMDYLLRDSHHAGVGYGRFDHYRLIDTMRILPTVAGEEELAEPTVGIEEGGIQSAEALLHARYLMYSQLYFHPVRRIYDIHLKDFLSEWLPNSMFSTNLEGHLAMTDNEVMSAILTAAPKADAPGHGAADTIVHRKHFRVLYARNPQDISRNPSAVSAVYRAARAKFGTEHVRIDDPPVKGSVAPDFPVLMRDGRVASSLQVSQVLNNLPGTAFGYVFIDPEHKSEATNWLDRERDKVIQEAGEGGDD
jgi:HD superfamily phosphohydrolase